jgi:hypothetical protein
MATDTLEATLIPDSSVLLQDEDLGHPVGGELIEEIHETIPSVLRCGERGASRVECTYEVQDVVDGAPVVVKRGEALTLNRSDEGVLLVMARPPRVNQMIEVHTRRTSWRRTASVYEARWTKPVHIASLGDVCLVGCRRVAGPCQYVSF